MKWSGMVLAVFVACALSVPASSAQLQASPLASESHNPIARVVGLLKSLAAKVETEGKAEEKLYYDFVCWGKSVIAGKTASNSAAEMRINELEQVIADLDSGKTELTSERTDLEKEIATLEEEKESATAQRDQEEKDFDLAEEDMTMAIAALKKAINVLDEATKDSKQGSLLSVRKQVSEGMATGGLASLEKQGALLQKAVELGDRFLQHADSTFLRRLLTGDVPTVDWKKLNRKATFRMSYKARSVKIQAVLANMLKTFETNLEDAREKEASDKAAYDKLMKDKSGQLESTREAYSSMAKEKGAKAMSREEASSEVDALKEQIKADSKFIEQTQDSLATKKAEWKTRYTLRSEELAAISKAIDILYNDDARDLMKKSFASHGYLLLQEMSQVHTSAKARLDGAATMLRRLASVTKDRRILALAPFSDKEKAAIQPAIAAIDALIKKLEEDEADDLAKKEQCENDRAADTRAAILKARLIDEKSDEISELKDKIEELDASIATTIKNRNATEAELAEATANRNAEKKEYLADSADDKLAAQTVLNAKEVLTQFYKTNKLMLVQQPVTTVAGQAPTPPPETWEGAYGGATDEVTGIFAILDMVHEDITKDIAKGKAEEEAAAKAYGEFKAESEASIKADNKLIAELQSTKGDKIKDKGTATDERSTAKGTLNAILKTIEKKASSGCDYFAVNYKLRVSNRQIELDGLTKAKAYLEGGEFSKVDPNREMTPGDAAAALVQGRSRRLSR